MLKKILIGTLVLVAIVAAPVLYFGYKFLQSGDTYGEDRQIAEPQTLRRTIQGDVVGFEDITHTHTWMGIPYAAAPVGDLRWKAPQKPASWDGTLEALQASGRCKQIGSFGESRPPEEFGKPIGSENCLYLNIFAPKMLKNGLPAGDSRLPVMVYMHGGGNVAGYANQFKYSGRNLANKHEVIVVSFNYRLGLFGWFSHPALNNGGSPEDRSGNYGILDGLAALQWIQDNIAAFGGNPDNVTLFGESAGGMNIFAILASPSLTSREGSVLFHKAIVQSGLPVSMPMEQAQNYIEEAGHENSGREVTNRLLISDGHAGSREEAVAYQNQLSDTEVSAYLREISADKLLMASTTEDAQSLPMIFRDGVVVPAEPLLDVFSDVEKYSAVPIMIGTNRDEFKPFFIGNQDLVTLDWGFLPRVIDPKHFQAVTGYFNDSWKARGVDEVSIRLVASRAEPVFAYRFDWDELPTVLGVDLSQLLGAVHASEVPFVFESFDDRLMNSVLFSSDNVPSRTELSEKMSSYWVEFAFNGSPGKGRDGTQSEWRAWSEKRGEGKFVMLDSERGGGIRMNNEAVTLAVLKQRLLGDTSFPTNAAKSRMYHCLFKGSSHWKEEEFSALGGETCDIPIFGFLRL